MSPADAPIANFDFTGGAGRGTRWSPLRAVVRR